MKLKVKLSQKSIMDAVKQLQEYKELIKRKTSIFVQRLAELGIETIDVRKNNSRGDADVSDLQSYVWLDYKGSSVMATLVLAGKDVAFVEFGAGVHYNTSAGSSMHPKGMELGMTIGSYGKGQGKNDFWFYYDEGTGKVEKSYGTRFAMPVGSAAEVIRHRFINVAKEVFSDG